ncbi:MAG: hypothetical protein ACD_46C00004G0008 [uncultured bacterium]|nr:MAG: hypothetical protein ACD_46C00004G0008 [uncultured bacterium]
MSDARKPFIELLHDAFKNNELKTKTLEKSKKNIKKGLKYAFDDFPFSLVDDFTFDNLWIVYQQCIKKMPEKIPDEKNEFEIDKETSTLIQAFENWIARIACDDLLYTSQVKEEIITSLEWESKNKLDIADIICSFVKEIHHQLSAKIFAEPNKEKEKSKETSAELDKKIAKQKEDELFEKKKIALNQCTILTKYINKHFRAWMIDAINTTGNRYNSELRPKKEGEKFLTLPKATTFLTIGTVALAMVAGVLLFNNNETRNSQHNNKRDDKRDDNDSDYSENSFQMSEYYF